MATGPVYEPYLDAARANLEALLERTKGGRDAAFEREAQYILDCFNLSAIDMHTMIAEVNGEQVRAA
jgi:hypothetical protein